MAAKKSDKGPLGKNGQAWTERQKKLVKHIPTSKSHAEAAKKAGYPAKNAAQSAYQALRQMRGRVPDLMERNVEALDIQSKALDMAFLLHGSYAPRDPKEAAQFGVRVIRVDIPRPPGEFNQFIDVIPESALSRHGVKKPEPSNGKPVLDNNGND